MSNDKVVTDQLERKQEKAVLSQHSLEGLRKTTRPQSGYPVTGPRFELRTSTTKFHPSKEKVMRRKVKSLGNDDNYSTTLHLKTYLVFYQQYIIHSDNNIMYITTLHLGHKNWFVNRLPG